MKKQGNPFLYIGIALSAAVTALIVAGYFWTPYDPTAMESKKFLAPSWEHLLGTDNFGRDIFSRVLEGAGTSFFIAVCVVLIGCFFGIIIGSLCGYYGGVADLILTRVCDSITAFPSILLALVIITVLGSGTYNIVIALGILFIPSFARIVRGEFARCRDLNYIKSARLMGVSDVRIMFCHILPNTYPVLLSAVTIGFNNAVLSEASMSYLGIGVGPAVASLGRILSEAHCILFSATWFTVFPALVVILIILGVGMVGEGLRERVE